MGYAWIENTQIISRVALLILACVPRYPTTRAGVPQEANNAMDKSMLLEA